MHLDLFVRNCFPKWTEIFTVANKIMSDMSTNDPEFYGHLKNISKVRTKINPKDFVAEVISLESKQQPGNLTQYARELMSDPIIFLRKWMGEVRTKFFFGFSTKEKNIGLSFVFRRCSSEFSARTQRFIFGTNFLWSVGTVNISNVQQQLFFIYFEIGLWARMITTKCAKFDEKRKKIFLDFWRNILQVFLEEACLLHTADVQAAFVHLAIKNDTPRLIPAMNQRLYHNRPRNDAARSQPELLSQRRRAHIEMIGIKDITLTLSIPEILLMVFSFESFFS